MLLFMLPELLRYEYTNPLYVIGLFPGNSSIAVSYCSSVAYAYLLNNITIATTQHVAYAKIRTILFKFFMFINFFV